MKKIFFLSFLFLSSFSPIFAQKDAKILTQSEINQVLPQNVKQQFGITFPLFRVYSVTDKSNSYVLALTESNDSTTQKDTFNQKIKAFFFKKTPTNTLEKVWDINDFTTKMQGSEEKETSIWFWTKYLGLEDIDKDGSIDPIITYGTSGINGQSDGRLKILIYYKGQKIAIRHQNGILDFERNTQVDAAFYTLPTVIQEKVKQKMQQIVENDSAIFPAGWEKAMQQKKTKFDEKM